MTVEMRAYAKTAVNVIRYCPGQVVAVLDSTNEGRTSQALFNIGGDIPVVSSVEQVADANTLLIGIAVQGGQLPREWRETILTAISKKMNVISGMHEFLSDDAEFAAAAREHGVDLIDVRKNDEFGGVTRQGIREDCLRIHTVGNDCSVGKMVAAYELHLGLKQAGHDTKFVATGQTGIMIEGEGCPIDCVVSGFVSGAAERLVLKNQHHDILVVEGQGSLLHPRFSGVTIGLLHGCMPHGLILCYEAGRTAYRRMESIPLPSLRKILEVNETMANLMCPCRVIGVAVNTRRLSRDESEQEKARLRDEFQLPVCDVYKDGCTELVEAVLKLKSDRDTS